MSNQQAHGYSIQLCKSTRAQQLAAAAAAAAASAMWKSVVQLLVAKAICIKNAQ